MQRQRPGVAAGRRWWQAVGIGVALASTNACSLHQAWVPPERPFADAPAPDSIDSTLLLIGDSGDPALDTPEPVLEALRGEAARAPNHTFVVFLGDNIYPDGMPDPAAPDRARGEAILRAQADVIQRSGARGIFLPGNHDHHHDGRRAVRRQAQFITALAIPGLEFRPVDDCVGPESIDVGDRLRLVVFDSSWWIHDEFEAPAAACSVRSETDFANALETALASAGGREVIVAAHHPIASHGWHGGFFTWDDHLFPLHRAASWLWLPLPGVGSLYPLYRSMGGYRQDLASSRYQNMLGELEQVFHKYPPLAFAGGHDHNLQVLAGRRGVRYSLVSGSGSMSRPDPVSRGDDTICVSPQAGFMRLDFFRDGRVRLEVVEVHTDGRVERPCATWLGGDVALDPGP